MKYCSIDIETSGLDPEKNCVLSIGAIVEDTELKLPYEDLPKFSGAILQREILGSPRAITINKELIGIIGDYLEGDDDLKKRHEQYSGYKFYEKDDIIPALFDFLFLNQSDPNYKRSISEPVRIIDKISYPALSSKTRPLIINVAGKNFGTFDKIFLQQLPWWKKLIIARLRLLDPAILCCKFNEDDTLPSLNICKERMGIKGEVTHNALEDAWDVIQVLRNFY
jgi:hypothetical protein